MEANLRITDSAAVRTLAKAVETFRDAADDDGTVDCDHVNDVFGETDIDSSFVVDLLSSALVNAGVLTKAGRELKVDGGKLAAFVASLKA